MDSTLCAGIAAPTPKLPRLSSVTSRQVVVLRFEATQAATDERSASVEPPRPVGRNRDRTAAVSLRGSALTGTRSTTPVSMPDVLVSAAGTTGLIIVHHRQAIRRPARTTRECGGHNGRCYAAAAGVELRWLTTLGGLNGPESRTATVFPSRLIVLNHEKTEARNSLTRRMLALAAGVGCISAWLGSLLTPTIGLVACAYGLFGVGFLTGQAWKRKSLPPDGSERRRALASGAFAAFVFSLAVQRTPAMDSFRQSVSRATALWSVNQVVAVAVVMVSVASMVHAGMALQLVVPFCTACKRWARAFRLRIRLDCENDELKEHLLAEDFGFLSRSVRRQTREYVFDFATCRCDGVQKVCVTYDPDPSDETPLQPVINMALTKAQVELLKEYLPPPDHTAWSHNLTGLLSMAAVLFGWLALWMRVLGFQPY